MCLFSSVPDASSYRASSVSGCWPDSLFSSDGRSDPGTNDFARDNQFHAPILLPARVGLVRSHRLSFSKAFCRNLLHRNSRMGQVIAHSRGALFGELLVVIVAAHAVGMAFHIQLQTRVPRDDARHSGQLLTCSRPQ